MQLSNGFVVERRGAAIVIRFDRPDIRNPLSIAVVESLTEALVGARDAEAVVFTGSDGVFASGADLREIARVSADDAIGFAERGQRLMNTIAGSQFKTIAAIDGPCFGGALDLALACVSRVASPRAEFCHPGAGLGIMTGWGGTQRLPRLVGEAAALELFLTGTRLSAGDAERMGLVDRIERDPLAAAIAPYL